MPSCVAAGRLRIGLRLVGRHGRHRGLLVGRPSRLAVRRLSRLLEGLLGRLSVCAPGRPRLAVPIWCRLARLPLQRLLAVRALRRHVARLLAARGLLGGAGRLLGLAVCGGRRLLCRRLALRVLRLSGLSRPLGFGHDCSLSSPRKASAVVATSSMASCGQASTHRPQPMQWRASSWHAPRFREGGRRAGGARAHAGERVLATLAVDAGDGHVHAFGDGGVALDRLQQQLAFRA